MTKSFLPTLTTIIVLVALAYLAAQVKTAVNERDLNPETIQTSVESIVNDADLIRRQADLKTTDLNAIDRGLDQNAADARTI